MDLVDLIDESASMNQQIHVHPWFQFYLVDQCHLVDLLGLDYQLDQADLVGLVRLVYLHYREDQLYHQHLLIQRAL